jgi:predicted ester cyclase
VWNHGNVAVIHEVVVPAYVVHAGSARFIDTAADHQQTVTAFRAAFPDVHFTLEEAIAAGDKVVARIVGHATHTGSFFHPSVGELAATGNAVTIHEIVIYRIAEGKLAECWAPLDWLGLLQQLGALPSWQRPQLASLLFWCRIAIRTNIRSILWAFCTKPLILCL